MKVLDKNLSNGVQKIKYLIEYNINETPRYRPLINDGDVFDTIPEITNEANDSVATNNSGNTANNVGVPTPAPKPSFDNNVVNSDDNAAPNVDDTNSSNMHVDEIQNEIMKHNIEAMKNIHSQLENLTKLVTDLNTRVEKLSSDVDEVREPSNVEKLMSKKVVSYPYYFNLNDYWSDNWFKNKYSNNDSIKRLPDGTYVANFDDLPSKSSIDINKSFDNIQEF